MKFKSRMINAAVAAALGTVAGAAQAVNLSPAYMSPNDVNTISCTVPAVPASVDSTSREVLVSTPSPAFA